MIVQQALRAAIERLRAAGIEEAPREARLLMAMALGSQPDRLTLRLQDQVSAAQLTEFEADVARRATRLPLSHILGGRQFYSRWFQVNADVLDPRPDTETLIAAALRQPFERLLDLGTGSGCILLTLLAERPKATGLGVDFSADALRVASANLAAMGLQGRAELRQSDWFSKVSERFDLIVANPPYIAEDEMGGLAPELAHEPRAALSDGGDGLGAYRAILAGFAPHLTPGGRLMFEIGWQQGKAVRALVEKAGLRNIEVLQDLGGRDRVVSATAA